MNPASTIFLLRTFAVLLIVLGLVMLLVFGNVAIGASNLTIGFALIAVAAATGKKQNNG